MIELIKPKQVTCEPPLGYYICSRCNRTVIPPLVDHPTVSRLLALSAVELLGILTDVLVCESCA